MTGYEPRISGIVSDRFTNWATSTDHCEKNYSKDSSKIAQFGHTEG